MCRQWAMHGQSPVHSASIPLSMGGYLIQNTAAAVLCFALLFFAFFLLCFYFKAKHAALLLWVFLC